MSILMEAQRRKRNTEKKNVSTHDMVGKCNIKYKWSVKKRRESEAEEIFEEFMVKNL